MELNSFKIIILFFFIIFFSGCGGGGGSSDLSTSIPVNSVEDSNPLYFYIAENTVAPSPLKNMAVSDNTVKVGNRTYVPDENGFISNAYIKKDELININDEFIFTPVFKNLQTGLFLKFQNDSDENILSQVYYEKNIAGGVKLSSSLTYRQNSVEKTYTGNDEIVSGGAFNELVGRYVSKLESESSTNLNVEFSLLNNEQILKNMNINPFVGTGFSGEVSLIIEPPLVILEYNEKAQFFSKVVDEAGTTAVVDSNWYDDPEHLVDIDINGLVTSSNVPGIITLTAKFENLSATASVQVMAQVDGVELSGNLTEDKTLDADTKYVVVGDYNVKSGATLTIEGGTQIYFLPGVDAMGSGYNFIRSEIFIEGTLRINGLVTRPAVFRSDNILTPKNDDYFGFIIRPEGIATVENANFYHAINPFRCEGGTLSVKNCIFDNCQLVADIRDSSIFRFEGNTVINSVSGLEFRFASSPEILRNYFADIHSNAITIYTSNPMIYGNIFLRQGNTAIHINGASYPVVGNNIIISSGFTGINVSKAGSPRIVQNIIDRTATYGIYLWSGAKPEISNNILTMNGIGVAFRDEIDFNYDNNNCFDSEISHYLNLDQDNDLIVNGTSEIFFHELPNIYNLPVEYKNANFNMPNTGDFTLADSSVLLDYGLDSKPVGLLYPGDVGTSAVNLGKEVTDF